MKSHQISWPCSIPNGSYKEDNLKEDRICPPPPPPMWNRVKNFIEVTKSVMGNETGESQIVSAIPENFLGKGGKVA